MVQKYRKDVKNKKRMESVLVDWAATKNKVAQKKKKKPEIYSLEFWRLGSARSHQSHVMILK